jgi:hypothetical protein
MDKNKTGQQNTEEVSVSKTKKQIMMEAQRIEESCLFSSKGHFVASGMWSKFHLIIGIPVIVLSAVAGASFLSHHQVIASLISIGITVLSGLMTFLNPNQTANSHKNSGSQYYSLENKVRIFRTIDCWREESEQVLTEKLKYFSEQKDRLSETSPIIPHWAYWIAKKGIEAGEAEFAVDKKE